MKLNSLALFSIAIQSFITSGFAATHSDDFKNNNVISSTRKAVDDKNSKRPNVVVFLVDDLRPELGCYGAKDIKSPNIDAIAKDGILFEKAYAQEALSAPSRMSILTGQRPETIGIYSLFTTLRSKHKDMITIPQFFKEKGYTTVGVGKVYHHNNDDARNWSIQFPKEPNAWVLPESLREKGNGTPYECADVADDAYPDGRTANNAIATLKKLKDQNFVMFVGLCKPHLPFNAPKKYWDMYNREDFAIPLRKAPKGSNAYSLTKWAELRAYMGMPSEGFVNDEQTKALIHGYHACVSYTDAQIGKVMQTLKDLKLRDNTLVVVIGDHGWKLGEYGAWCKHSNFEIDVNAPLIISQPTGLKKRTTNVKSKSLVEFVDLFATMADVCGYNIGFTQGKSLLPLINNPKMKWNEYSYSLYPRGKKVMGFTCTDGTLRYTEWWDNVNSKILAKELYTCKQDYMKQAVNHVDEKKYASDVKRLKEILDKRFPESKRSSYPQYDDK